MCDRNVCNFVKSHYSILFPSNKFQALLEYFLLFYTYVRYRIRYIEFDRDFQSINCLRTRACPIAFKLLKNLVTIFYGVICNLHGCHYVSRYQYISARDFHLKIIGRTQIACICIGPNNTLLFMSA